MKVLEKIAFNALVSVSMVSFSIQLLEGAK